MIWATLIVGALLLALRFLVPSWRLVAHQLLITFFSAVTLLGLWVWATSIFG